jgi:hypothetical protein
MRLYISAFLASFFGMLALLTLLSTVTNFPAKADNCRPFDKAMVDVIAHDIYKSHIVVPPNKIAEVAEIMAMLVPSSIEHNKTFVLVELKDGSYAMLAGGEGTICGVAGFSAQYGEAFKRLIEGTVS